MICDRCHGKGRIIEKVSFGQGQNPPVELDEISPCPNCHGQGIVHCCDGDREQAMLNATEHECNPNEG